LLILEAFGNIGKLFANAFKNLRKWRYFRLSMLVIILAGLTGGVAIFASVAFAPNALSVEVNGVSIGTSRWDRGNLDPEYLIHHTITRLESQFGTTVTIADDLVVRGVRAGRNAETITFDAMVTTLAETLEFYVYGAIITVNGRQEAFVGSYAQAEALLEDIANQYREYPDGRFSFVENVTITTANIHRNDITTMAHAQTTLTTHRPTQEIHIVRPGESLYTIARRYGMTLAGLTAINPDVNPDGTGLRENHPLIVMPTIPIISVRTYERVTTEQVLSYPTEHRPNPALATGQQRIIQQGRPGLAFATLDIISINGVEVERVTITQQNTTDPLPHIIEVGSG